MQKERWMGEENKSWWTRLKGSCRLVPEPAQPLYSCRKRPGLLAFGLGVEHRAGDLHSQIGGSRRMSLGKSLHVPGSLTQAGDGAGINGRKRVWCERAVGKLALGLQSFQSLAGFQMLLFWLVVSD